MSQAELLEQNSPPPPPPPPPSVITAGRAAANRQEFEDAFGFTPEPFSLEAIRSSKNFPPQKVVIYGVPGVGKTSFAATWPKPILLRTEDGAGALDVPTFPQVARSLSDVSAALNALLKGRHDFKTLILDSLDWTEPFVWEAVCQENSTPQKQIQNIEDFGFGKGYVKVDAKWQSIQAGLEMLRERCKMHIVCIAHAVPVTFDPPDSDPYQRYSIKLHKRAAALWTEWAEMLLFVNYKAKVRGADSTGGKGKATGKGERVIYTQERPAYQAKSRWPLPEEIYIGHDTTWADFHAALNEASEGEYRHD